MEGQVPGNVFLGMSLAGIEPVGFRVKSDLRNHQAIVQPRLYDCLIINGYADLSLFKVTLKHYETVLAGRPLRRPSPSFRRSVPPPRPAGVTRAWLTTIAFAL
jgi:hypothetical protein